MTEERFRRAKEIFHDASERPAEDRSSFVAAACGGNPDLRHEVESLLASADAGDGFLDAARFPTLPRQETFEEPAGTEPDVTRRRIGPYTLLREIGRGGMGSVYLAERSDHEYRGRVALKLVKRGMDTDFILQRFRAERQILASLNHPNIARLLDGGTTDDGLPYFVMEFIEGQNLTEYCGGRNLTLRDRIDLFRIVCAAVQYAHRSLVVHRDIKPSNLLVTEDGAVKLLDFGLAKVIDPQRSGESFYQTVEGVGIFTPEYASPEQARAEAVTTATDVYSLGVVLYELLACVHPYRRPDSGPADLIQAILQIEPAAPSAAAARKGDASRARALVGDLDTIVLTAIRKEPERRYATVEKLSADLGRHLAGLPVSARPDTLVYRSGKFVRRHRLGIAAGLLVILSLLAGLSAALWQARVAREKEALANTRFHEVRKLAKTVLFDLHDRIKPLPGSTPVRALLVTTALDYLNRLSAEAGHDRDLLRELAEAYVRVGDVQGGVGQGSLGDTLGAVASYRKALVIREALCADPGAEAVDRGALAESLEKMSDVLWLTGDNGGSVAAASRAVTILDELLRAAPGDPEGKSRLARAIHVLADAQEETGDFDGAVESSRRGARLYEEVSLARPDDARARSKVLVGRYQIGVALLMKGDAAGALPELRRAVEIGEELTKKEPGNSDYRRMQAFAPMQLGRALAGMKDWEPALAAFARSRTAFESILAADPLNANVRMNFGSLCSQYGHALAGAGRRAKGAALQRDGLAALEKVCLEDPGNAAARKEKADATARLVELGGSAHQTGGVFPPRSDGR
ncbi:MAG: protein kinase [Thermoanaerobaculia bacterium]|nr:protein kinase [Thermoanaerobaculia bacterium]